MKKQLIISSIALATILSSCGGNEQKKEEAKKNEEVTTENTVDSTTTVSPLSNEAQDFQKLKDNVQVAWDKMVLADDEKLASLARLLDEISFNPKHDEKAVAKGREMIKVLKAARFSQTEITTEVAGKYDNLTDSTINYVFELAEKTPDMDNYPLKNQLVDEIRVANDVGTIASISSYYDDAVKAYNTYVLANAENVKEKPLPSFTQNLMQ